MVTRAYRVPPPKGSNNHQYCHRLGTKPSTPWPLKEIQEPNYRPTESNTRHKRSLDKRNEEHNKNA